MQFIINHNCYAHRIANFISALTLSCIVLGCGTKVVRTVGQDGELKELIFNNQEGIQQKIIFNHNRQQRILLIEQTTPGASGKIMEMKVRYAPDGRITFIAKKTYSKAAGKNEAEFDSFSYSKSGEVTRIETSFKSAYSISKHNTALIIAQYKYQSGILKEILENGGTFKRIIKPEYSGNQLKSLEFSLFIYQPKTRTFEKTKDLHFHFSGDTVRKASDRQLKKNYGRAEAQQIFENENAGHFLRKMKFGTDITTFLKHAESYLIEKN